MNEKEIHLRDYFRIVTKRKSTILTFLVVTFVLVVIATFTATPLYLAVTQVIIEKNTSDPLSSRYQYAAYDPEFLETQYQLIKSASVIQKVVKTLDPEKTYDTFFAQKEESTSYLHLLSSWIKRQVSGFKESIGMEPFGSVSNDTVQKTIPESLRQPLTKAQKLERIIKNGISISPVANSRVVQIGFISDNPAISMRVANTVAQAYIDELVDMQMEVAGYSIGWMTKKAEVQRMKLEESEQALHDYKKQHDIITIEDRLTILPERLADLSKNLTSAQTQVKELFAVYNQVRGKTRRELETIPVIVENASVDNINQMILVTEQKISELSKKYGPKHPRMITASNELESLKRKKAEALNDAVKTIENAYLLARQNERDLTELFEQTKFTAAQLGEKSIQLGILTRNVETNRYLYDALVKQMKEKDITEQSQSVNVWVIEEATLPEIPAKPQKKRNLLLGLVFGLFGGVGLAFFLEYLDNTVKTPEDVEERFDIPVISTIDLLKTKDQTIVENVLNEPSSLIAESFKALRTSIFLSSADKPPRTLLVTSMIPGEGKSSVAACLCASIAQTGKRVLLIDADMRRPVQHRNFPCDTANGLSTILAGISQTADTIHPNIIENLDLIPAGPVPPNPSELLSSRKMEQLITELSSRYDMLIVDSPPLASVTDPVILSQRTDGIIIVTWAGKTTYEMLGKGLKQLSDVKAPFTGLVLNRFNAKKSGYYYNYGDYYYSSES